MAWIISVLESARLMQSSRTSAWWLSALLSKGLLVVEQATLACVQNYKVFANIDG